MSQPAIHSFGLQPSSVAWSLRACSSLQTEIDIMFPTSLLPLTLRDTEQSRQEAPLAWHQCRHFQN